MIMKRKWNDYMIIQCTDQELSYPPLIEQTLTDENIICKVTKLSVIFGG